MIDAGGDGTKRANEMFQCQEKMEKHGDTIPLLFDGKLSLDQ